MEEQSSTPLIEFTWLVYCVSAPIFLVALAILVCVLRRRKAPWLRIVGLLPFWLLANALTTPLLWVVLGSLEVKFKHSYFVIFAPAIVATLITTVSVLLILRTEAQIPHSRDEA